MKDWKLLPLRTKIKIISIISSVLVFTTFLIQNLEKVNLAFLFWTFRIRLSFLFIFSVLTGVGVGFLFFKIYGTRERSLNQTLGDEQFPKEKEK